MASDIMRARYRRAAADYREAVSIWELNGEPQSGRVFDELTAAREEFKAAMRGLRNPDEGTQECSEPSASSA